MPDRRLEVAFYTSNLPKFLQARLVFERNGIVLRHFPTVTEAYEEDYSLAKDELLARALGQVLSRIGTSTIVFVEDTSLRIEALSDSTDFPGLSVKEWFAGTTFRELDGLLSERGNDRRAVVKSDIALYVPLLGRTLYFHGETRGVISNTPPEFRSSTQHPWLTAETFNGWIVPTGVDKRLGEMSVDESWEYDFRIKSLSALLDRLEEYSAILNLPPHSYSRRERFVSTVQPALFADDRPPILIVGRTCAGKTTAGEYLANKLRYRFIEASNIVRMERARQGAEALEQSLFRFAQSLLEKQGPDYVARRIFELYGEDVRGGIIISGFRTIEEVEALRNEFPNLKIAYIEAQERTRYERFVARAREEKALTYEQFLRLDHDQGSLGLLRVAEELADLKITNEDSLDEYLVAVAAAFDQQDESGYSVQLEVAPRYAPPYNRVYRCLKVLAESNAPMTTEELQLATEGTGKLITHNNVNKVLKNVPELARRINVRRSRVTYEITSAGRSYVRLIDKRGEQK
jgi:inosine/xanthosine triphosphate pyrophosphatase family protein/dephospho-CoA kinase